MADIKKDPAVVAHVNAQIAKVQKGQELALKKQKTALVKVAKAALANAMVDRKAAGDKAGAAFLKELQTSVAASMGEVV